MWDPNAQVSSCSPCDTNWNCDTNCGTGLVADPLAKCAVDLDWRWRLSDLDIGVAWWRWLELLGQGHEPLFQWIQWSSTALQESQSHPTLLRHHAASGATGHPADGAAFPSGTVGSGAFVWQFVFCLFVFTPTPRPWRCSRVGLISVLLDALAFLHEFPSFTLVWFAYWFGSLLECNPPPPTPQHTHYFYTLSSFFLRHPLPHRTPDLKKGSITVQVAVLCW